MPLGGFPDRIPDITLVNVHLSTLGEVEVFGPGMAVVDDELYWFPTTSPKLAAVVDVFTSDIS